MLDPSIGRWFGEDPIDFGAGDASLYRYVGNNPTNATDPRGLQDVPVIDAKIFQQLPLEQLKARLATREMTRLTKAEIAVLITEYAKRALRPHNQRLDLHGGQLGNGEAVAIASYYQTAGQKEVLTGIEGVLRENLHLTFAEMYVDAMKPGAPRTAKERKDIADLIEQMGDANFCIREKAQQDLRKLGYPAEEQVLEAGRMHKDQEIQKRAQEIIASRDAVEEIRQLPLQLQYDLALLNYIRGTFGDWAIVRDVMGTALLASGYQKGQFALNLARVDAALELDPEQRQAATAIRAIAAKMRSTTPP